MDLSCRSLAVEPAAGHSAHARAHAHYETGDHLRGLSWMDEWVVGDGAATDSLSHFSWHAALHELSLGDLDAVRARYQGQLRPEHGLGCRALVDTGSLLWRWALTPGADDVPAMEEVTRAVNDGSLSRPATPFLGMHAAVALLARRSPRIESGVIGATTIVYTIPSLALFSLLLPFTGLSPTTVIIGLALYSLTILVRNVLAGLLAVPDEVVESARGVGYSNTRLLTRVELPLALPVIMAGLRVATVSTVALVTIGAIVSYGGLVFVSGIGAHFEGDIKAHTAHVLDEMKKRLEQAGSSMEKVLKVNVYLNDLKDYAAMNEVFLGRFGPEPGVRTTIAAAGGIPGNSLVEIDCIAAL